ncbi:hypothetical protein M7I_8231 [Glarea lozoyensis 74030]|uniref:Uncharacterized protein n=1 Tax=Glarea lozoyensis (strain ATCC 74030 / MF5533) TaxID=1104152 RepID=H0EZG4_GLAL7|nr:hypothetical protein M7I_8231 [Glarea lozoyensis 74030]
MDIDSSPSMARGVLAPPVEQHQPVPDPRPPPPGTEQPRDFLAPPKPQLHSQSLVASSQVLTDGLPSVSVQLGAAASVSPIPAAYLPSGFSLGTPRTQSLAESEIDAFPQLDTPDEDLGDDLLPRVPKPFLEGGTPYQIEEQKPYKLTVQEQLVTRVSETVTNKTLGFVDQSDYLVELEAIPKDEIESTTSGAPGSLGEATYFTALAVVALAPGNYEPDEWGKQNADAAIGRFLKVLEQTSWDKTDFLFDGETSQGTEHPIRHPKWLEWNEDGRKRIRPMSKDAFGPIVAACYYTYNCPNSSEGVRTQSQRVIKRWVTYLSEHSWTIHTNWAKIEFVKPTYSSSDRVNTNGKLGIEAFLLLPHELYALKLCAESLSVPHSIIIPFFDIAVAVELAIPIIVKSLRDALDHVLDYFNYSTSFDIELIRGWRRSAIKGHFFINILAPAKTPILDAFEAACKVAFSKNAHIFIDPHARTLGFDTVILELIDGIIELFPEALKLFPLGSVLVDLFKQLLPWFDTEVLSEFFAFVIWFLPTIVAKDSDFGYFVWSFAVLLETRPSLVAWMRPSILSIFAAGANRGNPNGIWAWLADEKSTVMAQIKRFEDAHVNNWRCYAYTKNYEQWLKNDVNTNPNTHGPASSRLDYLLLQGLAKKGTPPLLPNVQLNLKLVWEGFATCIQGLKDEALRLFNTLGSYERQFVDRAGALVRETIDLVQGFTRNVWKEGIQTSRFVHSLAEGFVEYTAWTVSGLAHHMKWAKALSDLSLSSADIIHLKVRNVLDVSGAIKDLKDFTVMQIRAVGGELKQWVKSSGVLLTYMVWASSSISGVAGAEKMILHTLRLKSGPLFQWKFEADKGLTSFTNWADSRLDFTADVGKVVTSTIDGAAGLADCVLFQARALDSSIEEWHLELGVPKQYRKWIRCSVKSVASGKEMVKSIEKLADGRFVTRTYQDGIEKSGIILDKWGNELEKIGKGVGGAVQDVGDSIGKLFPGWHI